MNLCEQCLGCNRLEYQELKQYKCVNFRSGMDELERTKGISCHQLTLGRAEYGGNRENNSMARGIRRTEV